MRVHLVFYFMQVFLGACPALPDKKGVMDGHKACPAYILR
jgi:hypothetical protein